MLELAQIIGTFVVLFLLLLFFCFFFGGGGERAFAETGMFVAYDLIIKLGVCTL